MKRALLAVAVLVCSCFLTLGTAVSAPISNDECLGCHGDKDLTKTRGGKKVSLFVDAQKFGKSVHKKLACVECHSAIKEVPHDSTLKVPNCEGCHPKAAQEFHGCIHDKQKNSSMKPSCQGCHGTHDINKRAVVSSFKCQKCHQKIFDEYKRSVHGEKTTHGEGLGEIATCIDCHGAHRACKVTDPRSPVYHLNLPKTCGKCHANEKIIKKYHLHQPTAVSHYEDSIHGRAVSHSGLLVSANCSDCHGSHLILRKDNAHSTINRANVNKMCASCHAGVYETYKTSIHGTEFTKGNKEAPTCVECHHAHEASRVSDEHWMLDVIKECGTCHKKYITTYRDSYHGKVTTLGYVRVAKCADCHGSHNIMKRNDPKSMISKENIVKTCGACHPGSNEKFTQYIAHSNYHDKSENAILYYTYICMTGLLLGTFGFFGVHALLWLPRSWIERIKTKKKGHRGK